jgi:hypothetical protein
MPTEVQSRHGLVKNLEWEDVRRMPLSKVDILDGEISNLTSVGEFRSEWEVEFLKNSLGSVEITCFGLIFGICSMLHFVYIIFTEAANRDSGGNNWIVCTWLPKAICGAFSLCTAVGLNLPLVRATIAPSYHETMAGVMIVASYLGLVVPCVLLEVRSSMFSTGIESAIDFKTFPPTRFCKNNTSPGPPISTGDLKCNNVVLSSQIYVICLLLNLLPRLFRTSAATAIVVSFVTAIILLAALLLVGAMPRDWAVLLAVALQLVLSLFFAGLCAAKRRSAREAFALTKRMRFATAQNRGLLHALIPEPVVDRLARHAGGGLLGGSVRDCAVMFCSLEPRDELQAAASPGDLAVLDAVFSALDNEVADAGMFKYQHVGCVPTCRPFNNTKNIPQENILALEYHRGCRSLHVQESATPCSRMSTPHVPVSAPPMFKNQHLPYSKISTPHIQKSAPLMFNLKYFPPTHTQSL